MGNIEPSEEFRKKFYEKWNNRKNLPEPEIRNLKFDELPWEDPDMFNGEFKDGDLHFIKFGKMGVVIQINTMRDYGNTVAVFSDENEDFRAYVDGIAQRTDGNTHDLDQAEVILRNGVFCMAAREDKSEDRRIFYIGERTTQYTPKNIYYVADGKSANNISLQDELFLPFWIKQRLLPEGVMKYVPISTS